jgi:hypothetical protein
MSGKDVYSGFNQPDGMGKSEVDTQELRDDR